MGFLIPATAKHIEKKDKFIGGYSLLEINAEIKELSLGLLFQLAKKDINDSMDLFNDALVDICESYLQSGTISWTDKETGVVDFSARQFARVISKLAFQAFEDASKNGAPFKVEVTMPNTKKKEFEKINKESLDEIKELRKLLQDKVSLPMIYKKLEDIEKKIGKIEVGEVLEVNIIDDKETEEVKPKQKQSGPPQKTVKASLKGFI